MAAVGRAPLRLLAIGAALLLVVPLVICGDDPSLDVADRGSGDSEEERLVYDAIRSLHVQLDDDADGQIDKSESDEFLREELNYVQGYGSRQDLFHRSDQSQDTAVSVRELWEHWRRSAVHNWTTEQTVEWLVRHVHLPQYRDTFELHHIAGPALPRLAVNNNHYLSGVLGIKDPRHKQKIMLKAMDAVLFGPPKDSSNLVKDALLLTLLLVVCVGCWLVYRQNQKFKRRMLKMTADMESLTKAEQTLLGLQVELDRANKEKEVVSSHNRHLEQRLTGGDSDAVGATELERLRSQVEVLTEALRSTEAELEDRCWNCPPALQHWLQLTYELELRAHQRKRAEAERQLEDAKLMCDKLRKKQNSLYGALVSTHGRTVNDVDTSIVHARRALLEVTEELQERTYRWRQIELICGFQVVQNPGLPYLESLTRTLQRNISSMPRTASSLRKSDEEPDADSVSQFGQSATSAVSERSSSSRLLERDPSQTSSIHEVPSAGRLHEVNSSSRLLERDSSQSSYGSVRLLERDSSQSSHGSAPDGETRSPDSIAAFAGSLKPSGGSLQSRLPAGQQSPSLRRGNMVKSHSHDAAVPTAKDEAMTRLVSRSESALDSSAAAVAASQLGPRLRQVASNTPSTVDEEDAGTDSSSVADDADHRKTKRKFLIFRRPKSKAQ
ncbi:stromal interaction molecule homolog isoform X2 [Amphibalanus amphitrite]|uniref:stromal interaction molecule homolog isoform X2 n=1 Tax=Amphibalanus amphitrite TaxID=1232801 RepID=UPI001C90E7BD|nr:stromal interaction molecule homolog isoform X2 [Amphibalanus amphitrite]XP_043189308.1 stromal interaction molecule homolog isoform X2 [Amphibalanus amphitrite]XP_043189309.1 stromal interaction molecule homolog isoform X2 [Amphibalanus amphitrite]